MDYAKIRDELVKRGKVLFDAPSEVVEFTSNENANKLLNDIKNYPHAFVLASIMDRQIKAEKAWLIPYFLQQKLGDFSIKTLSSLSRKNITKLMKVPEPLHRFPEIMSDNFFHAIQKIENNYQSDASLIWQNRPSSAEVIYKFLEFNGVGPKIATMAANILARELKVPFSDYYSIDISADIHVKRTFTRLGLISKDSSIEQIIYRARSLYPEFPGLMDSPCWHIGRNWCRPSNPKCNQCYMNEACPKLID